VHLKRTFAPALLAALFAAVLIQQAVALSTRADDYAFFDPIIDIRHLILERFVEQPDEEEMLEAAISGMLDVLDDPHTVYVPPVHQSEFAKDLHGTYVGIGAEVTLREEYLTIVSPMDGSPALEAGVRAGDVVLEIEGESTYRRPVEESVTRLTGEPGTPVTIRVRHLNGEEESLQVVRRQIVTTTVRGLRRMGEEWTWCVDEARRIDYVRITQFNQSTTDELEAVLRLRLAERLGGLILDLRDNPGGELTAAVDIADLFLERGPIVSVRNRSGQGATEEAKVEGTLPPFPVVILVNHASASASEIVAGALQENGRAKVLGVRSHGKGSVQEVRELPLSGGTLKLTTAYYYLPSGRNLHRRPDSSVWGVDPDPGFLVVVSDEDYLRKLDARREAEVIRDPQGNAAMCTDQAFIRQTLGDEQLARAVEIMQRHIDEGSWPAPSAEGNSGRAALEQELQRGMATRSRMLAQLERIETMIADLQEQLAETGGAPRGGSGE
jgi:carboxyl-terminal processing protease